MKVVIKYRKTGMIRFLSPLETNKAIERNLRRAKLPLVFSQGFHPTPKISYLDSIATGVAQRALYLTIEVKSWQKDFLKAIREKSVDGLYPERAWIVNFDINTTVTKYAFSLIMEKTAIDKEKLNRSLIIKKGKKRKEYKLEELTLTFDVYDLKKFVVLKYTLLREKLFSPWEIVKAVKIHDGLFIPVMKNVFVDNERLDSILDREAEQYG